MSQQKQKPGTLPVLALAASISAAIAAPRAVMAQQYEDRDVTTAIEREYARHDTVPSAP